MTDKHITAPAPQEEDLVADQTLRPTTFDEFVGQSDVAENLKLDVNLKELESARWFSKKDVQQLFAEQNQEFSAPRPIAIAHHLIRHWLANS